ncbi:MAG: hypothetical protein LRZ97_01530 [Candidatus Pacebacteria bacterium]|nr:hypothetical protein [Candidatus Paceibacterota bacterium]
MTPKLEQVVRKWLSNQDKESVTVLREYLKRIVSYNNSEIDFGYLANRIPNQRLCNSYFSLEKVHIGFLLSQEMYGDIFLNPKYSKYLTVKEENGFYLEGKPYIENGIFRNVHSLPNREIISLIDSDFKSKGRRKVFINESLQVSIENHQNRPFYKPRKGGEPFKIMETLCAVHVEKTSPVSGGQLSKKIHGSITKSNQISSTIDKMRVRFKSKLGHDLISNDSGYYLDDSEFEIVFSK